MRAFKPKLNASEGPESAAIAKPRAAASRPAETAAAEVETGTPLDTGTRAFFESRFGHDFSRVRVHTDDEAARATRAVGARAYTVGRDIFFGSGSYRPDTSGGRLVLAHELAHVVQQSAGGTPGRELTEHTDPSEAQAEQAVAALTWGGLRPGYGSVAADAVWHSAARAAAHVPALSRAGARVQRVQLTYDDGPDSAGNTRKILDDLNAAGARATFYLVGKRVAQGENWRVVFDIAASGHWIGNHAFDWDDATDNHIFLKGTTEERANKILMTEWAIRDALTKGRGEAKQKKTWDTIPASARDYIDDLIAHGTGRFRTPGFRSKAAKVLIGDPDGATTLAAIASVNKVLAATGLRPLRITQVGILNEEGVDIDPEDWRRGRTQQEVESKVKGGLASNDQSILLHSRIGATAAATPAIVSDIKSRKFTFDPTVQGQRGSVLPMPGFAGLSTISDPPTSAQIAQARKFLRDKKLTLGPFISGSLAVGIFQLAQRAGQAEVMAFASEIKSTTIDTKESGPIPMANWMNANEEWRLFSSFFENWVTNKPFPRIKGVTI